MAVLAHIRHTHTNYDHLLKLVPWAEARKRVEGPTLDVLISWRSDVDDDTNVMRDVLREVIIISDDEDEEDDLVKVQPIPNGTHRLRERSVEIISANNNVHTRQLDLAMEPPESENEQRIQYIPREDLEGFQRPHDRLREERQGAQRHQRWEEAISRQRKHGPSSTSHTRITPLVPEPIYQTSVQSDLMHRSHMSQGPPAAPTHRIYEDQRIIQINEPQRHLPLQRVEYQPGRAMRANSIGPVSSINSMPQVSVLTVDTNYKDQSISR